MIWDADQLREKIIQTILDANDLPHLPETVFRIMRLTAQESTPAMAVAQVILQSPTLTAKVLRYANSPLCGFRQEITSVQQAVVLLGFGAIRDLVLGLALIDLYDASRMTGLNYQRFLELSFQCAAASHLIASNMGLDTEEVFIGGLLHDIGTLLLGQYQPQALASVFEEVRNSGDSITHVEKRILGLDHTLVGALLAARWRLPRMFIDVIRHHHELNIEAIADPTAARIVPIIGLADAIVRLFRRQRRRDLESVMNLWFRFFRQFDDQIETILTKFPSHVTNFSFTFETKVNPVDSYEDVAASAA